MCFLLLISWWPTMGPWIRFYFSLKWNPMIKPTVLLIQFDRATLISLLMATTILMFYIWLRTLYYYARRWILLHHEHNSYFQNHMTYPSSPPRLSPHFVMACPSHHFQLASTCKVRFLLAPQNKRQRSFSTAELSVVRLSVCQYWGGGVNLKND